MTSIKYLEINLNINDEYPFQESRKRFSALSESFFIEYSEFFNNVKVYFDSLFPSCREQRCFMTQFGLLKVIHYNEKKKQKNVEVTF